MMYLIVTRGLETARNSRPLFKATGRWDVTYCSRPARVVNSTMLTTGSVTAGMWYISALGTISSRKPELCLDWTISRSDKGTTWPEFRNRNDNNKENQLYKTLTLSAIKRRLSNPWVIYKLWGMCFIQNMRLNLGDKYRVFKILKPKIKILLPNARIVVFGIGYNWHSDRSEKLRARNRKGNYTGWATASCWPNLMPTFVVSAVDPSRLLISVF
jgi:hypothetical protein